RPCMCTLTVARPRDLDMTASISRLKESLGRSPIRLADCRQTLSGQLRSAPVTAASVIQRTVGLSRGCIDYSMTRVASRNLFDVGLLLRSRNNGWLLKSYSNS